MHFEQQAKAAAGESCQGETLELDASTKIAN